MPPDPPSEPISSLASRLMAEYAQTVFRTVTGDITPEAQFKHIADDLRAAEAILAYVTEELGDIPSGALMRTRTAYEDQRRMENILKCEYSDAPWFEKANFASRLRKQLDTLVMDARSVLMDAQQVRTNIPHIVGCHRDFIERRFELPPYLQMMLPFGQASGHEGDCPLLEYDSE
ncbi:hypothetical protein BV25DRAFT_1825520 [Artomyces pyxidatus]|uniref:Uncharacterized protein n=1 Tax=Artomyces pyxidatus TaxID=48021 RepID=A0ACB8T317_9AGAM|nr:hypothetical protein BV25DRAFT_1825520 [Artomyces pyxidatus]